LNKAMRAEAGSCRDIEGESPLYPPQANVYDRATGLGPCLLVTNDAK
jgi:fumarylacetoacetate (FAA) hydrolase family protein